MLDPENAVEDLRELIAVPPKVERQYFAFMKATRNLVD